MIKNVRVLQDKLKISYFDKSEDSFLNIWLRDHAKDKDSWDHRSNQRKIYTAKLQTNIQIRKAEIKDNGKSIDILWSDTDKITNYPFNFFLQNSKFYVLTKIIFV